MNTLPTQQDLSTKELTIGEILSIAWKLFTQNFQLIALIILAVYIPLNLILSAIPLDNLMAQSDTLTGFRTYLRIIQLLEALIGIVATMAIAFVIKAKLEAKNIDFKQAMYQSLSIWPKAIGTNLLSWIFLIGLMMLLIVPGVIYGVYWAFVLFAVIFKEKSGMAALAESKTVVEGRWWKVLGYLFAFGLLGLIAGLIAGIPLIFLTDNLILTLAGDILIDIVASFFTVASVIFYLNFEATKKPGQAVSPTSQTPAPITQ